MRSKSKAMNEEKNIKKDKAIIKKAKKIKEVQSPIKTGLKTKEAIVANWLPRYTGRPLDEFGQYIILITSPSLTSVWGAR